MCPPALTPSPPKQDWGGFSAWGDKKVEKTHLRLKEQRKEEARDIKEPASPQIQAYLGTQILSEDPLRLLSLGFSCEVRWQEVTDVQVPS